MVTATPTGGLQGNINIAVSHHFPRGGGMSGIGGGTPTLLNNMGMWLRRIGIAVTAGELLRHSKIASATLKSILDIFGAFTDLFLISFLPIIKPILAGLASLVNWFAKFMRSDDLIKFLMDSIAAIKWDAVSKSVADALSVFLSPNNLVKIIFGGVAIFGTIQGIKLIITALFGSGVGLITRVAVLGAIFGPAGLLLTSALILGWLFKSEKITVEDILRFLLKGLTTVSPEHRRFYKDIEKRTIPTPLERKAMSWETLYKNIPNLFLQGLTTVSPEHQQFYKDIEKIMGIGSNKGPQRIDKQSNIIQPHMNINIPITIEAAQFYSIKEQIKKEAAKAIDNTFDPLYPIFPAYP